MKRLEPGTEIDGFVVRERLHAGGMADIYRVEAVPPRADPGFPLVMKLPHLAAGDSAENLLGFEVECQIHPTLGGPHVPRFVAAGDFTQLPYLVMERVPGQTLQHWLDQPERPDAATLARLGAAMAEAAHHLHQQNVCHLDLKPGNVLIRPDGQAVLLDFGLSCHAHYPDLLAEELRKAVGSPAWMAPEQVVGVRGDLRSDVFAIGVMLYELATGELPFGAANTTGGLRQRLWMAPTPPRRHRPELPEWLQEIILRCLEPQADDRYPSAAHLAFDLRHPEQVRFTARGQRLRGVGFWAQFRRWVRAAGMHYQPSPLPQRQIDQVPIVLCAIPYKDVQDATLDALRQATARALGAEPGARLACVTVLSPNESSSTDSARSETTLHRQHHARLRQWAQGLPLPTDTISFHVLEALDVAEALLAYARGNQVQHILLGAATHGLALQRLIDTVPLRVARDAPCTVTLVKPASAVPITER